MKTFSHVSYDEYNSVYIESPADPAPMVKEEDPQPGKETRVLIPELTVPSPEGLSKSLSPSGTISICKMRGGTTWLPSARF